MYYSLSVNDVLDKLNTSLKGLTSEEAEERIKVYGPNKFVKESKISLMQIIFDQIKDVFVLLLIFALIVSLFFGDLYESILIGAIIIFNLALGTFQNYKAEKAIEMLKKYMSLEAKVIRDGKLVKLNSEMLVPGDLVILEEGDKVPADGRLIKVINLKVNQAILTGESNPVGKNVEKLPIDTPVPDRKNMVYAGSFVVSGRGVFVVTATGLSTEIGKIAKLTSEIERVETPLKRKLSKFAKKLAIGIFVIILLIFMANLLKLIFSGNFSYSAIAGLFLISIALAVSAVPEGLPAAVTIALSLGAREMAKQKALVRRLSSVETLGSVDVLCVDKTGTLTKNEMKVVRAFVDGKEIDLERERNLTEGLKLLLLAGALANDGKLVDGTAIGDPTDCALLTVARDFGIKMNYKRIKENPFSSSRRMISTINIVNGKKMMFAKGAVEVILSKSKYIWRNGRKLILSEKLSNEIQSMNEKLAKDALRVLAIAYKDLDTEKEENFVFVGLVGMMDPPREEVFDAYKKCSEAGVKTVMITGDHRITAIAIAKMIGIYKEGLVITGEELDSMSDEELDEIIEKVEVFARVLPEQKLRIVRSLQRRGHVVGMTGDGVNDAPALKQADIGIAVNSGTDVAKEASDMILLDDNYATIVSAIEKGREIYSNIRKFSFFLMRCNFDEIAVIATFSFIGLPLPLTAPMILWENLITDGGPAIAMSVDPPTDNLMKKPPRKPNENLLEGYWPMIIISFFSQYFSIFTLYFLSMFLYGSLAIARSMIFVEATLRELLIVWNSRSETKGIFRLNPLTNKWLLISVLISASATILLVTSPLVAGIGGTNLNLEQILISVGFASVGLLVMPEWFYGKKIKLFKRN